MAKYSLPLPFPWNVILSVLIEVVDMIRGVPLEVTDIVNVLEWIVVYINQAESRPYNRLDGSQKKATDLREVASRLIEAVEEYSSCNVPHVRDPELAALRHLAINNIEALLLRLEIAYKIPKIRSRVREINERSANFGFGTQNSFQLVSSSSGKSENTTFTKYEQDVLWGDEPVGFDVPRDKLVDWLSGEGTERTVVFVVGMGGVGKSKLARAAFKRMKEHFECPVWIRVLKSYTVDDLLEKMLEEILEEIGEKPPKPISEMDRQSLIEAVRKCLEHRRYVVVFDGVWIKNFWSEIQFAALDNGKRSRVLITTRSKKVAEGCNKSFSYVENLQPLPQGQSQLLRENACPRPTDFEPISSEIVRKCDGLPLGIVAIGNILSTIGEDSSIWDDWRRDPSSELTKSYLTDITEALAVSYDDLQDENHKSCFLYFGIYPEGYEVDPTTLLMQWIAEGFVKGVKDKTLEEAAELYLQELIQGNLVQVSSFRTDGKAKRCRVHNLFRETILQKIKDLTSPQFIGKDFSWMILRLRQIATRSNHFMATARSTLIRSLYIFSGEKFPEEYVTTIHTKYKHLKVLYFEDAPLESVPENIGYLFHLRYLSFRKSKVKELPDSIGNLQWLETLDLRETRVRKLPTDVKKLRNLRHLLANHDFWGFDHGIEIMEGFGNLVSLHTLRQADLNTDQHGGEPIKELEKLTQLRLLGLIHVKQEHGSALCSSINKMQHLRKLYIDAINSDGIIDLHQISSLPALQKLCLRGKLERLPQWIPKLQNLVKLSLISSKLSADPLESLKDMPELLFLSLDFAYEGDRLHFQDRWFQKLKKLSLRHLYGLNSIIVSNGALPSLEELMLVNIQQLKEVPSNIDNLGKLKVLHIINMPEEFKEQIQEKQWTNKQVQVNITDSHRENYWDKETRFSRDSSW